MIVIKNSIVLTIFLVAIIFFIYSLIYNNKTKEKNIEKNIIQVSKDIINDSNLSNKVIPTKIFPEDLDGYKIVGKLEIPKINLSTYILENTNETTLNKTVTKLCGPNINEPGNFCILGHNYNKTTMFGNLKRLEINDTITLINMYGQKVEYKVYDIYKVYPNEVECLNQETYGEREVTLITCTAGAIKRLVVKAIEIYD